MANLRVIPVESDPFKVGIKGLVCRMIGRRSVAANPDIADRGVSTARLATARDSDKTSVKRTAGPALNRRRTTPDNDDRWILRVILASTFKQNAASGTGKTRPLLAVVASGIEAVGSVL